MIVVNRAQFARAISHINAQKLLAVDLETTGLYPFNGDKIIGVAVASPQRAYYFPFGHKDGPILGSYHFDKLSECLHMPGTLYVGHNLKFDLKFLHEAGVPLPARITDTMVGAKLHNENESAALKTWADKYIGAGSSAEQDEVKDALKELGYKGKKAFGHLAELSPELVGKYAIQDVRLTLQVFDVLRDRLARYGLLTLWTEYNEYLLALTRMELRGVAVDLERCDELSEDFDQHADYLLKVLRAWAGNNTLNPNSPKQICELLDIGSSKKTVMEKMAAGNGEKAAFAETLLEYRKRAKARGTYFEPYKTWADRNNVIHPTFNIGGTRTGRLSCSDPNLQQVPRDANTVKSVFRARNGKVFIEADYAQAELRLATHLADEPGMIEVFNAGRDPHTETAERLNVPRDPIAKNINFGIIYGIGANGLAAQSKVSVAKAREYLKRFNEQFPNFKKAYRQAERDARNDGFVRLWTGRIRRLDQDNARLAFNSLIQGGAAEIMRRAITRIDREHDGPSGLHMLITVHDSILFEVPEDRADEYTQYIRSAMLADNDKFSVGQDVDLKVGTVWGNLDKVDSLADKGAIA